MTLENPIGLTETKVGNDSLYDRDYYLWLTQTAKLIAEGKFSEVDAVNLVEEIEDMSRSEKRAVESNLEVLLTHLLKYQYQHNKRSNSWRATIAEHRRRIRKAFRDSPSLKRYFREIFAECYQDAREQAMFETGLPLDTFPGESPFTQEQTLNPEFLPEDSNP